MPAQFKATEVKAARSKGKPITLKPLHPNAGIEADYRKKLEKLTAEMNDSVLYWLKASYKNNLPVMAMDDAMPADALTKAIRKLSRRWLKQFDEASSELAKYFAKSVRRRTDDALRTILRNGGFSVEFKMTPAMRDVLKATVSQNVSLIKSIPEQYFKNIEGAVMRSVQQGRDLASLAKDLRDNYGVTKRRAASIALSQNNMATASMTRARQEELGLHKAKWRHSGGGKHPRPTHVKASADGVIYDVRKGWYDPHVKKRIWPGELPYCRCVSITVIPGFD